MFSKADGLREPEFDLAYRLTFHKELPGIFQKVRVRCVSATKQSKQNTCCATLTLTSPNSPPL